MPLLSDGVRAAQVVSVLAALGSVLVLFWIARHYVRKEAALACAFLLSITPLFIRLSMMTMSESIYIFWILLAILFFVKNKDLLSGLSLGLAAITRPEALALLIGFCCFRLRKPKRLVLILVSFLCIYAINIASSSITLGRFQLIPKTGLFSISSVEWQSREQFIDKEETLEKLDVDFKSKNFTSAVRNYFSRLPSELLLLLKHILPIALALMILGMVRKQHFFLIAIIPFFSIPAFTPRSEARFILPYLPLMILYAVIGVDTLRAKTWRTISYALLLAGALAGIIMNKSELSTPVSEGMEGMKVAGIEFKDRIKKTDLIADRKPFFSFYAGGTYREIPVDDYDNVLDYLLENNIAYLSLHHISTCTLRPALKPLLHNFACVNGELRLQSQYVNDLGVMVYEINDKAPEFTYNQVTFPADGIDSNPCWSPDGGQIVFVSARLQGIDMFIASATGDIHEQIPLEGSDEKHPSWSPDGNRIAFSTNKSGNWDIYTIDLATKSIKQITAHTASDVSPSWSPDGSQIYFCSIRSGEPQIWVKDLASGNVRQLSTQHSNSDPAVSPRGRLIAWIQNSRAVAIYNIETETQKLWNMESEIFSHPTWNPDERFIAISMLEWGSLDVYILDIFRGNILLLTKNYGSDGQPSWSPDGSRIAFVSTNWGNQAVWTVEGLQPFLDRIENPKEISTFDIDGNIHQGAVTR
jgi:WD40 repeat protein